MIKFSATNALVHIISPVIEIKSKSGGQPFYKQELIIDDSWDKDGTHYSNFVSIEFTGEKINQLGGIHPGMRVNVDGMLIGREYNNRIFNTIKGLNITLNQPQQQYPSALVSAPGYPQEGYPQSAYTQHPMSGYPQQQAQSAPPQQSYNSPNKGPGVNELPWNKP